MKRIRDKVKTHAATRPAPEPARGAEVIDLVALRERSLGKPRAGRAAPSARRRPAARRPRRRQA